METVTSLIAPRGTNVRDRELLLAHVLGRPREWLLAHPETPVRPESAARYHRLLARLKRGEPLPYLLGEHWFYGRPFTVNRHVLIPRPETELLTELVSARVQECRMQNPKPERARFGANAECRIIDIGTGSGCIAVTLAAEIPSARVIATDASPAALRVARANARRHGVEDRISFVRGNLLAPASRVISRARPEKSHMVHGVRSLDFAPVGRSARDDAMVIVLANLPYLTTAEWRALPRSIRAYEPRQALDGGPDGLRYYRTLFEQLKKFCILHSAFAPNRARSGLGFCILEIDPRRKRALTALIRKTLPGWRASWYRDLAGRWRVLELLVS